MSLEQKLSPARVRRRLGRLTDRPVIRFNERWLFAPDEEVRAAGVLMPLTEIDGQLHLLYTRRSPELRAHSGEISFPGGRRDPEDHSLEHTALRESHEEVALHPGDVSVFGAFATVPTPSRYQITSFIGEYASPYPLEHNPDEIDYMLTLPLEQLAAPGVHRIEHREHRGQRFALHFYDHTPGQQQIWGATAFMTYSLLTFLGVDH